MILLDTDVLVDAALEDGEHGKIANELLAHDATGQRTGCHSVA